MKKSTTATIAIIALLLGSGASGLLYAMPAHQEQDKLKGQKAQLQREHKTLKAKVEAEEAKLNGMAMDTISYFDLRKAPNKRRELEAKTVETLASLTEIFNDNRIKVVDLAPGPEVSGVNKPVPAASLSPEEAKKAEEAKQAEAIKAKAEAKKKKKKRKKKGEEAEEATEKGPEIDLVHKQFKFTIRGEYADLVTALNEIQGLPKAISVSQYDLSLLSNAGAGKKGAKKNAVVVEDVSPTALQMSFQMSVSFLMSGGPSTDKKKKTDEAADAKKKDAALPEIWRVADYWLGLPAEAAEPVASADKKPAVTRRHTFKGVKFEQGVLRVDTGRTTPRFEATGLSPRKFVVTLKDTTMVETRAAYQIGEGGIVSAVAERDPKHPATVRIVIETDGRHRFQAKTDGKLRLTVAPAGKIPHESPTAAAQAPAKPQAQKPAAPVAQQPAATAKRQVLQAVTVDGGSLLVKTSGSEPAFEVLGRHKTSIVIELSNVAVKGRGQEFKVDHPGVLRARAALYDNSPLKTRLVIDTDGTVELKPVTDVNGQLRVLIEPRGGAKVAAKPVGKAPAKPEPKQAVKPETKQALAKKPPVKDLPVPVKEVQPKKKSLAKAEPSPQPMPTVAPESFEETPRLTRSLTSSYSFPIDRERTTGRANPFKVIPGKREAAAKAAGLPAVGKPAVVPPPPHMTPGSLVNSMLGVKEGAGAPPAIPAPAARSTTYVLQAVVIWGKEPPLAVIQVDGKTHQVGLNGSLPGNARVKSIKDDYVVLDDGGRTIRLTLKK